MDWRISDIVDAVLASASIALFLAYHVYLCYKVRVSPFHTSMGINRKARRLWVFDMFIDNSKKNVLAVQTLRNSIMESTLMATTAVLLTAGLATYFTFTSSAAAGSRTLPGSGQRVPSGVKLMGVVACLVSSFFAHTLSIRFVNHVNYMVNIPLNQLHSAASSALTPDYVASLLERSTVLYTLGSRSFYLSFPLLLWVFGSLPMFACSILLLHVLYLTDFHHHPSPPPPPPPSSLPVLSSTTPITTTCAKDLELGSHHHSSNLLSHDTSFVP